MRSTIFFIAILCAFYSCDTRKTANKEKSHASQGTELEKYRPYFHFTPDSMWMNDPNGMVYHNGTYHLFYQYYPDSTVWGPMHWGHAVSTDIIHWQDKPIALYPDDHGYIFSGSAVLDVKNSSGFGTPQNPPIVAIYTYHDPIGAEKKHIDYQTQGIAYSNDNGETWTKYQNNPVLKNPGIADFRDPKVRWYEPTQKWIMTLAVKDHIRFYSSSDLKQWNPESKFGKEIGAHGGVWECPDLFPMKLEGDGPTHWILIVSLNPGGPNGGSGTQYFIGDFDGHKFVPIDKQVRWLDYGPDNYAGVTWFNTGNRTLFIGWMSNWKYAQQVPTEKWRSAMTLPRELKLEYMHEECVITSFPVMEYDMITSEVYEEQDIEIDSEFDLSKKANFYRSSFELDLTIENAGGFSIVLSSELEHHITLTYENNSNDFHINRSNSGNTSFHPEFGNTLVANRFSRNSAMDLKLIFDVASVELFADGGSTVMTAIFFPEKKFNRIEIVPGSKLSLSKLSLKRIDRLN